MTTSLVTGNRKVDVEEHDARVLSKADQYAAGMSGVVSFLEDMLAKAKTAHSAEEWVAQARTAGLVTRPRALPTGSAARRASEEGATRAGSWGAGVAEVLPRGR